MKFIGIDPGLTGAIALYDSDLNEVLNVWDIPVMPRLMGKGNQVDAMKLYKLLVGEIYPDMVYCVELVGSFPKQGVVSSFNFGVTVGCIFGVISSLGYSPVYIHSSAWKRKIGLIGSDKNAVIEIVKNSYPETHKWLTLKKHHNRAEAIAIAITGGIV